MLDLNQVRADFANYLASNASKRHSLDAALMHVVQAAYQKGLEDALQVPPVLRHAIANVDASMAQRNRSALAAPSTATGPARLSCAPASAGQGASAQSRNAATACGQQGQQQGGAA